MSVEDGPKPWRNRITGHGAEAPDQLLANPHNFRLHSSMQAEMMADVLDNVGWVQDVIVNRRTGFMIDGHLRVTIALRRGETSVPVTYVDLTDTEEALVLATFDPLGSLAAMDAERLRELHERAAAPSAAIQGLFDELREKVSVKSHDRTAPSEFDEVGEDLPTNRECPRCGYAWSETK